MTALPSQIVDLNSRTPFRRKTFSEVGLNEKALDTLVVEHSTLIADLLIENDIMEEAGRLLYLGRQFRHVDVLFAEVDEEDEPIRLVLVEDKLLKDPGAKRKVIGQVIEYAAKFQDEVRAGDLKESFPKHQEWLDQNAELLDRQIEQGDFLLIICGDSIHSNVADIVTRLGRRADRYPLSGMELCLIAMDLFERENERLLIPHVTGLVARATRQLEIRIVDVNGERLRAQAHAAQVPGVGAGSGGRKIIRGEDYFFREVWAKKFGEGAVEDWQWFIDQVKEADIAGLQIQKTSIGRPTLRLRSARLDTVLSVLRARTGAAGIRDLCGIRTWERSDIAVKARDEFRASLRRIPGATEMPGGNTVAIPIDKARTDAPMVIAALQQLGRALDSDKAEETRGRRTFRLPSRIAYGWGVDTETACGCARRRLRGDGGARALSGLAVRRRKNPVRRSHAGSPGASRRSCSRTPSGRARRKKSKRCGPAGSRPVMLRFASASCKAMKTR